MEKLRQEFNEEIGVLKGSKHEVKSRIVKTDTEKKILENTSQDQVNKVLEPHIYAKVEQQVKELYALTQEDKGEGKLGNASVTTLLNEIEKEINRYLLEFTKIEEKF